MATWELRGCDTTRTRSLKMSQHPVIALLLPQGALTLLKPITKKRSSTRVALLLVILFAFAAAVFCLAATAEGRSKGQGESPQIIHETAITVIHSQQPEGCSLRAG